MTQADKAAERGGFVQYPCQLIYNCPVLNRDDKWVLLSIMGVCWTEGPYRLSYRDIAALSGVPISLLSSVAAKDGKPAKEGIMDRLRRLEYIRCVMGKEKDTTTGKAKGNAQTYIYVNYTKIWAESLTFKGEAYKVNEPVLNTNTPVSYTNRFVPHANSPVPNTNESVSYTNEPVRDSRSKVDTYITVDNLDSEDTTALSDDECVISSSSFSKALVSHPEHKFLWFDDLLAPSIMVIRWTPAWPSRYSSEQEDEQRGWIADAVETQLAAKGFKVAIRREHETDVEIEQTLAENETAYNDNPIHHLSEKIVISEQIDENNRLTKSVLSPPETTTDVETVNATVSLSVVSATEDTTHADTQKTSNSYSPRNAAKQPIEDETAEKKPTRRTRKAAAQENLPSSIRKIETANKKQKHVDIETLEPEVKRIVEDWQSLFKNPIPVTDKLVQAATLLIPVHPTREQLSEVRRFAYVINPEWHVNRRVAVTLQSVVSYWEKWAAQADVADILATKDERMVSNGHNPASSSRKRIKTNEELRKEDPWS